MGRPAGPGTTPGAGPAIRNPPAGDALVLTAGQKEGSRDGRLHTPQVSSPSEIRRLMFLFWTC